MTARTYWSSSDATPTTTTSATPQVKTSVTIASPPATKDVLWVYSMRLSLPSLTSDAIGDFFDGSAQLSRWNIEGKDVTDVVGVAGIARWQTGGAPPSTTFSLRYSAEAAATTEARYANIVGLQMEAGDQYAETSSATTTNAAYQTATTLTFDPGGTEDYLLLVSAEIGNTSAGRVSFIQVSVDGVAQPEFVRSLKDVVNFYPYFFCKRITLASGTRSILLRYHSDGTATATIRNARIACLKIANFDSAYSAQDATADTTTQATYKDWVTLTATPETGDHLLVMNTITGGNVATISNYVNHLQDASVLAEYTAEAGTTTDTAAWAQAFVGNQALATASTTWKNQYRSETTSTTSSISWSSINVLQLFATPPRAGEYADTWDAGTSDQAGTSSITGDVIAALADFSAEQTAGVLALGDASTSWADAAVSATGIAITAGDLAATWDDFAATQEATRTGLEIFGDYAAAWDEIAADAAASLASTADLAAAWPEFDIDATAGTAITGGYEIEWPDAEAGADAVNEVGGGMAADWQDATSIYVASTAARPKRIRMYVPPATPKGVARLR